MGNSKWKGRTVGEWTKTRDSDINSEVLTMYLACTTMETSTREKKKWVILGELQEGLTT